MSRTHVLDPNPPEFERFLYASVGEDRQGRAVTVLSALARLNLDPWKEAADLAALDREAAGTRFGLLLSRVRDVPGLDRIHGSVGRELTCLLPEGAARDLDIVGSFLGDPCGAFYRGTDAVRWIVGDERMRPFAPRDAQRTTSRASDQNYPAIHEPA